MIQLALVIGLIGYIFVYLEFFVPGGLFAILGSALLLLSLVLMGFSVSSGMLIFYLVVMILLLLGMIKVALVHIKRSKRSVYLEGDQEGYKASSWNEKFVGKEGITSTPLNPSGHIFVENEYLQAIAKTGFIKKDTPIKIVDGQGSHYLVELLK